MTEQGIPYDVWIDDALRGVIRRAVGQVAEHGLPGEHHFYVTFRTDAEGVELSGALRAQHPNQMTIVFQHQFRDLAVDDEALSVTLRFKGKPERLRVPFAAIVAFADPSVNFGLQFKTADADAPESLEGPAETAADEAARQTGTQETGTQETAGEETTGGTGQVVTLDSFRKK